MPKHYLKRFWKFIWHDDSVASWIVSALLAFVLVKFIIYPGLGLALGTDYPVVAVVSGSMEHKTTAYPGGYHACGNTIDEKKRLNFHEYWQLCGEWYEAHNISKEQFRDFPLYHGFDTGAIVVLRGIEPEHIEIGDIIVYANPELCQQRGLCDPIIHRVVAINEENGQHTFQTKGDHNIDSDRSEQAITEEQLLGKAVIQIPALGYVKILAVNLLNIFR